MKKQFFKWMSLQDCIYKLAVILIANRIVWSNEQLTPKYLLDRGWIEESGYFVEPGRKGRDKIWIKFEHHYFKIFHGKEKIFIALESNVQWFENYYLLSHGDNGRYILAGI